jgi:hypothetical protein
MTELEQALDDPAAVAGQATPVQDRVRCCEVSERGARMG